MHTKHPQIGTVTLVWNPEPGDSLPPRCSVQDGKLHAWINDGGGPVGGQLSADLITLLAQGHIELTPCASSGWYPAHPEEDDDPPFAAPCSVTLAISVPPAGAGLVTASKRYESVQEAMRQIVRSAWRRAHEEIRRPHVIAGLAKELAKLDAKVLDPGSRVLLATLPDLAQSRTPDLKACLQHLTWAKPVVYGAFELIPICGPIAARTFDTLAEAVSHGRATITELLHDAQIARVQVNISGKRPVLVHAGDIVHGLRQHRIFTTSALITGTVILSVTCVERARWGQEQPVQGILRAPPRVRCALAAAAKERQSRVWKEVDAHLRRNRCQNPTESLAQAEADRREAPPPILPAQARGVIALRHGRFIGMEVTSHPDTLKATWPQLWNGWAEAADHPRSGAGIPAMIGELFMTLGQADNHEAPGAAVSLRVDGWSRDDDHVTGNAVVLDHELIHLTLMAAEE